ncbi:MAG: Ldh family oxidoreductase [Deltaproteobacteria bacterium]|nr:MAG: Ldh family oxidoreductase [Deltaproteobacteria bacterium]
MNRKSVSIVGWEPLKQYVKEIFVRMGMGSDDAETTASVLIWASLRGVDSHGVQLIPWYVEAVDIGHMKLKPNIAIEKETPASALIDADHAFGPVVTTFAMRLVMEKARSVGIGWAYIRKTNHQGAIGYYPLMAAKKDMAGIAWSCGQTTTAPYGSKFPGIANNPIAMAVPANRHRPLILDMATSVAAVSKLHVAKDRGVKIPEDWALDKDGNSTTDPWKAAILKPIGGPKGSGLSIMLECLTSIMVDFPKLETVLQGKEKPFGLESVIGNPELIRRHIQNSTLIAIDIGNFTDVNRYKEHIDQLIDGLKSLPRAGGFDEILVPGELEERTFDDRFRSGIPIPKKTASNLRCVGEKLGIHPPGDL